MGTQELPGKLGDWDVSHLGALYQIIRESRGLSKQAVAQWAATHPANLSRFEKGETMPRRELFRSLVHALRQSRLNGQPVRNRLKANDEKLLFALYDNAATPERMAQTEEPLAQIDLGIICHTNGHASLAPLKALHERLKQERRPAFIVDSLWFIHAVNGAALNLFGANATERGALQRWEDWHVIGAKFANPSPIREAHLTYNEYFPPTVKAFFEASGPYLLTAQMRVLIQRLINLSDSNSLEFADWWHQACAFNMPFKPDQLHRRISYTDITQPHRPHYLLNASVSGHEECSVHLTPDHKVRFWLGCWDGCDPQSQKLLMNTPGANPNQQLYYAADYDRNGDFHVNRWQELAPREVAVA